ncbi:MAG: heavy-metal-associated domain-containing protein [Gemmatimonadota bacterium]|nr:heavy-metal-associated domain-containing protein [Gemmatimonadota bacterium]MDH5761098.1 heavy-metal-associated domain-containing protein [Gemmatimonadota bacterium]
MEEKTVTVPNISCGHCVMTIEREVGSLDGVASVSGNKETRAVTISWDPDATDWVVIEETMEEINYPPAP